MEKLYPLFKIAELIAKEKSNGLSVSEKKILQNWISKNENNKSLYKKLKNGEILVTKLNELKRFDSDKAFKKVEQYIVSKEKPYKLIRFIRNYMKYAAAAAILIACSYFIIYKSVKPKTQQYTQKAILPGKQRAILITTGNQQIVLDSSNKKQIIQNELANIINSGFTLSYSKNDSNKNSKSVISYNTLITPRGGEYTVVLSDSTTVMLNADSKLKYPVIFDSDTRIVSLEGEAYFKVAKSGKKPFIVKTNLVDVIVHGTIFNLTAYNNENLIQTTLVEGSVEVKVNSNTTKSETKIKPGQQFIFDKGTGNTVTKNVNAGQFIAWTKGKFVFENDPIENILKALSRWYNFEIVFEDDNIKKQRFTLTLDRYDNVSNILNMISASSAIEFSIKGNKIIVK